MMCKQDNVPQLKREVRSQEIQVMDYFLAGDWETNIVQTIIRHRSSSLNAEKLTEQILNREGSLYLD